MLQPAHCRRPRAVIFSLLRVHCRSENSQHIHLAVAEPCSTSHRFCSLQLLVKSASGSSAGVLRTRFRGAFGLSTAPMAPKKKNQSEPVDSLTRIAIVSSDRCKPKKCRQECKKSCPVVKIGTLCMSIPESAWGEIYCMHSTSIIPCREALH